MAIYKSLIIGFLFIISIAFGFTENWLILYTQGEAISGGSTGLAIPSILAPYSNPSLLSFIKRNYIGIGIFSPFFMPELSSQSLSFGYRINKIGLGTSFFYVGNKNLSQIIGSLGSSLEVLNGVSGGISIIIVAIQSANEKYGSRVFPTGTISLAYVSSPLYLGVRVFNPLNIPINKQVKEYYTQEISVGAAYLISSTLTGNLEVNKFAGSSVIIRGGLLATLNKLAFNIGFHTQPLRPSFGIGFRHDLFVIHLGFFYHSVLGVSGGASIKVYLGKNGKDEDILRRM